MTMTAADHVAWAKQRACEYIDAGDLPNALASITSDLSKHPGTAQHAALDLGPLLAFSGYLQTAAQVREWIDGIN